MINFFLKHKNYLVLIFTGIYLVGFTMIALSERNYEFLYYTILMVGLIYLVIIINKRLHLALFILINQSLLGFLHLLGGSSHIKGIRLYDYLFFNQIRYDNFIHTYGTFITTITLYSLISNFIDEKTKKNFPLLALGLVLMSLGVGVLVELVEFFAVVVLSASEQVGDYFNNVLDLLFNTYGSILACVIIYIYRDRERVMQKINDKVKEIKSN